MSDCRAQTSDPISPMIVAIKKDTRNDIDNKSDDEVELGGEGFPAMSSEGEIAVGEEEGQARRAQGTRVRRESRNEGGDSGGTAGPLTPPARLEGRGSRSPGDDEGGEGVREDDGDDQERRPRYKKAIPEPTREEREAHNKIHVTYKPWCRHCVIGRGRRDAHRTGAAKKGGYANPHLSIDHGFLRDGAFHDGDGTERDGGRDGDGDQKRKHGGTAVLFGQEAKYGLSIAMAVPGKGNVKPWIGKRFADWLTDLGHSTVAIRADNERPIIALMQEVRRYRAGTGETQIERTPEGEKPCNSYGESGVNVVKGLIRTLKSATEANLGEEMSPDHPLLPWLVEQAAQLRNHYQVLEGGLTAVEKIRGRAVDNTIFEFAESVLYTPFVPIAQGAPRPKEGIYLGIYGRSGQSIIGTPQGVVRCRSVKARSEGERWNAEAARAVKGTPWCPSGEDGEKTEVEIDMPDATGDEIPPEGEHITTRRRFKIAAWMLREFGYTKVPKCDRCISRMTKIGKYRHTELQREDPARIRKDHLRCRHNPQVQCEAGELGRGREQGRRRRRRGRRRRDRRRRQPKARRRCEANWTHKCRGAEIHL